MTLESRPILLLVILKKMKFYVQTVTICSFAFLRKRAKLCCTRGCVIFQVLHFPVFVLFSVRHFQVLQIQRLRPRVATDRFGRIVSSVTGSGRLELLLQLTAPLRNNSGEGEGGGRMGYSKAHNINININTNILHNIAGRA